MDYLLFPENQWRYFSSPYKPFWVDSVILERLWAGHDGYFPPGTKNQLKATFFDYVDRDMPYFYFGRASVQQEASGKACVAFNGGRHRTRWLLDLGLSRVPLALSETSVELAGKTMLTICPISKGMSISLPITVPELQREQWDYENICNPDAINGKVKNLFKARE